MHGPNVSTELIDSTTGMPIYDESVPEGSYEIGKVYALPGGRMWLCTKYRRESDELQKWFFTEEFE